MPMLPALEMNKCFQGFPYRGEDWEVYKEGCGNAHMDAILHIGMPVRISLGKKNCLLGFTQRGKALMHIRGVLTEGRMPIRMPTRMSLEGEGCL